MEDKDNPNSGSNIWVSDLNSSDPDNQDKKNSHLRPPVPFWDRAKWIVYILGIWFILVWGNMSLNPGVPLVAAILHELRVAWWILLLALLELVRQWHYLVCETSVAWNRFWSEKIFGRFDKFTNGFSDWRRHQASRILKIVLFLVLLSIVLGDLFHTSPYTALFQLPAALISAAPLIFQLVFAFFFIAFQFIGLFWLLSKGGVDIYFPGDVKTRFSDVWGQDSVLERVKENTIFLKDPDSIEQKGGYVPGGILLWGPPGTGKTLIAEAVAGETENPFVFVDPGAFINMFMGVGILKVKSLFRKLRKLALRYGGVVVFFDEADSLGSRGSLSQPGVFGANAQNHFSQPGCNGLSYLTNDSISYLLKSAQSSSQDSKPNWKQKFIAGGGAGGGGGSGTLQALLSEISGLKKPRGFFNRVIRKSLGFRPKPPPKYRILVMMATNMPEALDEALLRPGRIDRIYKVSYPSKVGRIRTYEGYLSKVPHELSKEEIEQLATITPYATGATIKDLVNEALINTIREGRDKINWKDITKAKQLKDLGPPEDVEYIERERHAVAIHEACHAVVAVKVRHHLTIDIATIEKGGNYLGMVASIPPEDQFTQWRSEYESDIMVSLASLAGERMFFEGDNSSGVAGDLEGATQIATLMEGYWGMGSTLASHGVTHKVGIGGGGDRPNEGKLGDIDILKLGLGQRIEDKLNSLFAATQDLLRDNRGAVLAVAHALETHKTLTGQDLIAIVEGRQGALVDGRPYADPSFIISLEEYHSKALLAHKGHGSLTLKLPRIEDFEGKSLPVSTWAGNYDSDSKDIPDETIDL